MCPPLLNPQDHWIPRRKHLRVHGSGQCQLHQCIQTLSLGPSVHLSPQTATSLIPSKAYHRKRRPHGTPVGALLPSLTPWDFRISLSRAGFPTPCLSVGPPRSIFLWLRKGSGAAVWEYQVHRHLRALGELPQTHTVTILFQKHFKCPHTYPKR